ncbi:DUF349 domain-containing protein [Bacteroidota bacterium]
METQEEIIARMAELLDLPVEETMREANELKSSFYVLNHQKLEKQKIEHKEIGARMEDFVPVANPLEDKFKELFSIYRDNKAKYTHLKEEEEKKNLVLKKEVLSGLKELIDNEENIGKSFDRFKDFQDKWKSIGAVPKETIADLNTDYKAEVDRFYYNITINKELKEYDLAKNLEIREAIVKKLEELESEAKIKDVEFILSAAKDEWEDAGPVKPEVFQELRERYYGATRVLHKKIQDFYTERKDKMQANLDAKREMVARVVTLTEEDHDSLGKWNKATQEVFKIRDEWKAIGGIERKYNNEVWAAFKQAQDAFFDKKKAFLGDARESFKEHKEAKLKLIERAERLKDSTDWKETTDKFKRLQNDWKRIGSAGQRDENKLWSKFRAICDAFFEAKKAWYDGMDDRQSANLVAKEALLKTMSATKLSGANDEMLAVIQGFEAEWAAIDHVPKDDVSRIAAQYKTIIGQLYGQLKMDQKKLAKVKFEGKVQRLAESKDGDDLLKKEEHFIRKKMNEKKDELMKYENNMAFFKHAKPDNPLLISALKNIEAMQKEIAVLNDKLRTLKMSGKATS